MIVGTTLGCLVHLDELVTSGEPAGFSVATGKPGRWLRAMPRHGRRGLAGLDAARARDRAQRRRGSAGHEPAGANGLNVLPYLSTSGERAPFVDPLAAGQISGLRLTTNRDDLVRAVCEGLAYTARHCFEAAGRSGRIVVAGGGSRSSNWMQMFADVLEVPLELARNPEVGARGAVLAGAEARGEHARRRGVDHAGGCRGARRGEPRRSTTRATSARWSCSRPHGRCGTPARPWRTTGDREVNRPSPRRRGTTRWPPPPPVPTTSW